MRKFIIIVISYLLHDLLAGTATHYRVQQKWNGSKPNEC